MKRVVKERLAFMTQCGKPRSNQGTMLRVRFKKIILFFVVVLGLPCLAVASQAPKSIPDEGRLTKEISIERFNGATKVVIAPDLLRKWDGKLTEDSKLVLAEVLIYRKRTVQILLEALDRLRFLALALGETAYQDPSLAMPDDLAMVLDRAFDPRQFGDLMGGVGWLRNPLAQGAEFDPVVMDAFWRDILERSIGVVHRESQKAFYERYRGVDEVIDESVSLEENLGEYCRRTRDEIDQSKAVSQSIEARNQEARTLLYDIDGNAYEGERLLFTPLHYGKTFLPNEIYREKVRPILRDINTLRQYPGKGRDDGYLANFFVALALNELSEKHGFDIRLATESQPRSSLICAAWDEIPFDQLDDEFFVRNSEHFRTAFLAAIQEAIRLHQHVLVYLLDLHAPSRFGGVVSFAQSVTRTISRVFKNDYLPYPDNPLDIIQKLSVLAAIFQGAPDLMEEVRAENPMDKVSWENLQNCLREEFEQYQVRLEGDERLKAFNSIGYVGMAATMVTRSWIPTIIMVVNDAFITFTITRPRMHYRQNLTKLYQSMFLNVDPQWVLANEAKIKLDVHDHADKLRDLVVLDAQASQEFRNACGWMLGFGTFWAFRGIKWFNGMWRWVQGAVSPEKYIVSSGSNMFELRKEVMRTVKAIYQLFDEKMLVDGKGRRIEVIGAFRKQGWWKEVWERAYSFIPNDLTIIQREFPQVYRRLAREFRKLHLHIENPEDITKFLAHHEKGEGFSLWSLAQELKLASRADIEDWARRMDSSDVEDFIQHAGQRVEGRVRFNQLHKLRIRREGFRIKIEAPRMPAPPLQPASTAQQARNSQNVLATLNERYQVARRQLAADLKGLKVYAEAEDDVVGRAGEYHFKKKEIQHVHNIQKTLRDLEHLLDPVTRHRDRSAPGVERTAKLLLAIGRPFEKPVHASQEFVFQAVRTMSAWIGVYLDLSLAMRMKRMIPPGALSQVMRNAIAQKVERVPGLRPFADAVRKGKDWITVGKDGIASGIAKADDVAEEFARKKWKLNIDESFVSTFIGDSVILGLITGFVGDRLYRMGEVTWQNRSDGYGAALSEGADALLVNPFNLGDAHEGEETRINLVTGMVRRAYTTFFMTSALSFRKKMMWVNLGGAAVEGLTTAATNLYGLTHGDDALDFEDALATLVSPECLIAIAKRLNLGYIYNNFYALWHKQAYWKVRHAMRSPMMNRSMYDVFVLRLGWSTVLGKAGFTGATHLFDAPGECAPVDHPFEELSVKGNDPRMSFAFQQTADELDALTINDWMDLQEELEAEGVEIDETLGMEEFEGDVE